MYDILIFLNFKYLYIRYKDAKTHRHRTISATNLFKRNAFRGTNWNNARRGNTRLHELRAKFRATFERSSCFLSKRGASSLVAMFLVLRSATFSVFNGILPDICFGSSSSAIYSTHTLRLGIAGDVTLARHTRTFEFKYPIPLKVTSASSRIFSNFCFYNDLFDKV